MHNIEMSTCVFVHKISHISRFMGIPTYYRQVFFKVVCMYVYLLCHIYRKTKQVQSLKNSKNTNKVTVVKKQQSKLCIASQVNQTTDRDDKAHGAIALQLVNPSPN